MRSTDPVATKDATTAETAAAIAETTVDPAATAETTVLLAVTAERELREKEARSNYVNAEKS